MIHVRKEGFQTLESTTIEDTPIPVKKLLTYLQGNWDRKIGFVVGRSATNGHPVYDVWFHTSFSELDIFPTCCIQVVVKVNYAGIGKEVTYERPVDVTGIIHRRDITQPLFNTNGIPMERDMTADTILRWAEPDQFRIKLGMDNFLQNLQGKKSSKDLKIVAGNGSEVKCHRMIFEALSDVLAAMVSAENGMMEAKTGRIDMKGNSEEGIRQLVSYLYGNALVATELSCELTIELFQLAHKYELSELLEHLTKFIMQNEADWFNPDPLLELYFHVKNLENLKGLKEHSLAIIMELSSEVRNCERLKELNRTDPTAAVELLWKLFDLNRDGSVNDNKKQHQ